MGRTLAAALSCVVLLMPEASWAARGKSKGGKGAADVTAPTIEHTPLTTHDGTAARVSALIRDDGGVFEPTLVVRAKGGAYARVPMALDASSTDPDAYAADVPPELLAGDVEYFVEAFDTNGNGPARAGDEAAPFMITSSKPAVAAVGVATTGTGTGTGTGSGTGTGTSAAEDGGGDNTVLFVVLGVTAGAVLLLAAGAGVALFLYSTREKTPDTTRVTVDAPAPVAAVTP